MRQLIAGAWLCAALHAADPGPAPRGVGTEGHVTITLQRDDYLPKPLDDRTPVILRIEKVEKAPDGGFVYDFDAIGFEPGAHKLSDYLIHPDGSEAVEIGDLEFTVRSVLPPDHQGELTPYVARPFPWFGGYRTLLWILGVLWVLGLAGIIWFGRGRRAVVTEETAPPPPSYAERLRPYVEAAAAGKLTTEGQAELERLMTGYWREKLDLPAGRMADALQTLHRNAEAGMLLRSLERWLHSPTGASPGEVEELLEPYRSAPDDRTKEEMT